MASRFFRTLAVATMCCIAEIQAAPCNQTTSSCLQSTGAETVVVMTDSGLDLTNMFACEGGEFLVSWSGIVTVPQTICIGSGTTVWIVGSNVSSSSSISLSSASDQQEPLEALSTRLPPLPNSLTDAAVRTASEPEQQDMAGDTSFTAVATPGPTFFVNGGNLYLEGVAVRGGNTAGYSADSAHSSSTIPSDDAVVSGGGVHAIDANVTVVGCEFDDNFANYMGGGIFTNRSTLVVVGSVFRRCAADVEPSLDEIADDEFEAYGAGGGIGVENSDVLIDGCLFDDCYASKKGGGFHQEDGSVSITNSLFNNSAVGSVNAENEERAIGEGGAVSFIDCHGSFDGKAACGASDTVFTYNDAAKKGGAVIIWSKSGPSRMEFHRSFAGSNKAGEGFQDNPQGQGGVFAVGPGTTIVLTDCLFENNYAGDRGGVMMMAKKGDDEEKPGPAAFLRNCSFLRNTAGVNQGGVVYTAEYTSLTVEGGLNVFAYNEVTASGAVFAGTAESTIVVEGGAFYDNKAEKGGVCYTKGNLNIFGGAFRGNIATAEGEAQGGVFFGATGAKISIEGGVFAGNHAKDGGVAYVFTDAALTVEGGTFSGNDADNTGGGITVLEDGDLEITGGRFLSNKADFGGFLYKKGFGSVSCTGASAEGNQAVDGGGVYAVQNATLSWACDLVGNLALSGPAIYARENSTAIVHGATLEDNVADTGPVVLVVSGSNLRTYEAMFIDATGSADVSAVQLDQQSTYKAENSSFVGFAGEAVVFSRGALSLDDCDFSRSSASVLVYSEGGSPVIRNAVLGRENYYDDSGLPKADSLVNADVTCDGWVGADGSSSAFSPCSDGSCLNGVFGVYCLCYVRESNSEEVCVDGDVGSLNLVVETEPGKTNSTGVAAPIILPDTPEGNLLLSLEEGSTSIATTASASGAGGAGGVIWTVSASSVSSLLAPGAMEEEGMMDWTVFPSKGLLRPGQTVDLLVTTTPSDDFDGPATATFVVEVFAQDATAEVSVSFDLEFYHCDAGRVWKEDNSTFSCELCTDVLGDGGEGFDCSEPGSTTRGLPIKQGFWRSTLDTFTIRECLYEDACSGGASVASVAEYCNEGYEGPLCAICSSEYGVGVAHSCHQCSPNFTMGMYVAIVMASLLALAVAALLAIFLHRRYNLVRSAVDAGLFTPTRGPQSTDNPDRDKHAKSQTSRTFDQRKVGGTEAVSTTINKTKQSVTSGLKRSEPPKSATGGVLGVGESSANAGTDPVFLPALASSSGGGAEVGDAVVSSESLNENSKKIDKKTLAAKVSSFLRGLPLSKLKIVIVVWQISSSFSDTTEVPFPSVYDWFLGIIGIFSFDLGWILSAACLATGIGFFDKLLMVTIGPVFLFSLLGVTFCVGLRKYKVSQRHVASRRNTILVADGSSGRVGTNPDSGGSSATGSGDTADVGSKATQPSLLADSPPTPASLSHALATPAGVETNEGDKSDGQEDQLWNLFARHTTLTLIILYLVYSQVSTVVFQVFACEEFPDIGKSYLRADYRVECDTDKHNAYKIYAAIMICIYPLGIPAAFGYLLLRQGSHLNPPVNPSDDQQAVMDKRVADRAIRPTYFLWNAYVPNRYYYEVVECVRRLLLTGLLVFLQPDTSGQVAFGCIFAFISLMVFELLRPHADQTERQLYRTGCLLIFFTNFLALTIKAEVASPDSSGSTAYSVVLVIANVCFFLAAFSNTWFVAKEAMTKTDVTDMMFGISVHADPLLRNATQASNEKPNETDEEMAPAWDSPSNV